MEAFRERPLLDIVPSSTLLFPARELPWEGRNEATWRQFVKPNEAARLFMFLGKKIGRLDDRSIQNWHLSAALDAFWDGNTNTMVVEAGSIEYPRSDTLIGKVVSRSIEDIESLVGSEFIHLSMRRRTPDAIRLNESEEKMYQVTTNKLAELLWPITTKKVYSHHHGHPHLEELLSASAERFTRSLHSQYWESMHIDSFASIMHFISRTMPRGPQISEKHSDTRGMEARVENMDYALFRRFVGMHEGFNEDDLGELIGEIGKNPNERAFLAALTDGQYFDYAAKKANLTLKQARHFHKRVVALFDKGKTDEEDALMIEERVMRRNFWDYFFGNREELKALVESNGHTLPPFRRKLVEAVVKIETNNKDELLDRLEKEFPMVQRTTLRRHIGSGINRLRGKEIGPEVYRSHLSPGDKHNAGELVKRAQENPLLWSKLTPKTAEVLSVHFKEYPVRVRQNQETAALLGVDPSRVSRHIKTGLKILTAGPGS